MYGDGRYDGRVSEAQSKRGFNGQYCYTDIVKRGGRWQAVAEQATLLSQYYAGLVKGGRGLTTHSTGAE